MKTGRYFSGSTALVTGASGGIGEELARIFAREGFNLVLVARSADRLDSLARQCTDTFGVSVRVLVRDLSDSGSVESLYGYLVEQGIQVDVLVNNAGFGAYGGFRDIGWERISAMIAVNVTALTRLTHLLLPSMLGRGSGKVLNVASIAAFLPGPLMAVYYATKAYVLHLSEALAEETRGSGVTFTALCPGPTASGFDTAAGLSGSRVFRKPFVASPKDVAEYGFRALMKGKPVAVEGRLNRLVTLLVRVLPRSLLVRFSRKVQEAKN